MTRRRRRSDGVSVTAIDGFRGEVGLYSKSAGWRRVRGRRLPGLARLSNEESAIELFIWLALDNRPTSAPTLAGMGKEGSRRLFTLERHCFVLPTGYLCNGAACRVLRLDRIAYLGSHTTSVELLFCPVVIGTQGFTCGRHESQLCGKKSGQRVMPARIICDYPATHTRVCRCILFQGLLDISRGLLGRTMRTALWHAVYTQVLVMHCNTSLQERLHVSAHSLFLNMPMYDNWVYAQDISSTQNRPTPQRLPC